MLLQEKQGSGLKKFCCKKYAFDLLVLTIAKLFLDYGKKLKYSI